MSFKESHLKIRLKHVYVLDRPCRRKRNCPNLVTKYCVFRQLRFQSGLCSNNIVISIPKNKICKDMNN